MANILLTYFPPATLSVWRALSKGRRPVFSIIDLLHEIIVTVCRRVVQCLTSHQESMFVLRYQTFPIRSRYCKPRQDICQLNIIRYRLAHRRTSSLRDYADWKGHNGLTTTILPLVHNPIIEAKTGTKIRLKVYHTYEVHSLLRIKCYR